MCLQGCTHTDRHVVLAIVACYNITIYDSNTSCRLVYNIEIKLANIMTAM